MDRNAFLDRIRGRTSGRGAPPLPETLPPTQDTGDGRMFDRFAEELTKVGGRVVRVTAANLADAVAELAGGSATAVVASGVGANRAAVEEGLRRAGCDSVEPTREAAASADLGITGAELGVCSTGSVLVRMGPDAPRAVSLLPPTHVVVLPEERLVPGFEELFAALPEHARESAQTVLVTGPSRTADIEITIVRGVHGPERLVALVVTP